MNFKIPQKILWVLALLYVQQLSYVSTYGVDLPMVFTVLVALRTTLPRAVAWGALVGTLQDLLSADWLGPHLVSKVLISLLTSFSQRHVYQEKILTQAFFIFLMALFQQTVIWLLLKWGGSLSPSFDPLGIMARGVLGTSLAGIVVCFFVVQFRRRRTDPATA